MISGGHALVKALEKYIVPLVHGSGFCVAEEPIYEGETIDNLSIEAQELLTALKRFVGSCISSSCRKDKGNVIESQTTNSVSATYNPSLLEDENERAPDTALGKMTLVPVQVNTQQTRSSDNEPNMDEERRITVRRIMAEAHKVVFNRLPIRLLMFDKDGSGIRLVDRNQVWSIVRPKLEECLRSMKKTKLDKFTLLDYEATSYAVLSHTWLQTSPGEVTFSDWVQGKTNKGSYGYLKLQHFCKTIATEYHMTLAWMDTVCINKDSSTELDESIRSMYKWYRESAVCLVYLGDTLSEDDLIHDRWFTRGWTLQELIAPRRLNFFDMNWRRLLKSNDHWRKTDTVGTALAPMICQATKISEEELETDDLSSIPISRRMQWAANRNVTREEDVAYSLMGIFNVSMSTAYGEGAERAFNRLVREILNLSRVDVLDIVNCGHGSYLLDPSIGNSSSSLLPKNPKGYLWAARGVKWFQPATPVTLSHLGLCVRLLLVPGRKIDEQESPGEAQKSMFTPKGVYSAIAGPVHTDSGGFGWTRGAYFELPAHNIIRSSLGYTPIFAILNFEETSSEVILSQGPCLALLDCWASSNSLQFGKIQDNYTFARSFTKHAITFDIIRHENVTSSISKDKLSQHNMALRTCYL